MKKINHHILFLVLLFNLFAFSAKGQIKVTNQSDVILNQHWAMPTLLDPASTGDIDFIRIRAAGRLDYFGSRYSPKSFLATADSPFKLLGKRIGAGVVVNSMSYDLYRNLLISAQGSYKFKIKNSTLSVGLQIGYYHTKFKGSEMLIFNPGGGNTPEGGDDADGETEGDSTGDTGGDDNYDDQNEYPTYDVGAAAFDLAIGVSYTHPKFHVGLSLQHLTNPKMKMSKEGEEVAQRYFLESHLPMTMYFNAGGNIEIKNSLFTLQPSILVASDFSDFQGVAEMRATYNRKVTFGLNYRYNRAAGVLAGLFIKDFYVGYSWEYDYKANPRGSTGNHELVLGYQFKRATSGTGHFRQRSIRIM